MRDARFKPKKSKFHIRIRGLKEVPLFRDSQDKDMYLFFMCKYKKKYKFKVYGFTLMTTHGHFFINPKKADISNIMHDVNLCYAIYYNKKYDRYGPVFRGRFESDPVLTEDYCLALSAYIHNNSKDIDGYRGREEYFYYSSYGIYAGFRKNFGNLVDTDFILQLFRINDKEEARKKYLEFVKSRKYSHTIRSILKILHNGAIRIPEEFNNFKFQGEKNFSI